MKFYVSLATCRMMNHYDIEWTSTKGYGHAENGHVDTGTGGGVKSTRNLGTSFV